MAARQRAKDPPASTVPDWIVTATGVTLFLTEVVFFPGAASPFRMVKEVVALSGLAVCMAVGMALQLYRGGISIPCSGVAVCLALYPAVLAISAAWSASPRSVLLSAAAACIWVLASLWTAALPDPTRRRLIRWAAAGAVVSAVVLVLQAAGVLSADAAAAGSRDRLDFTGLAGNPNDTAIALILLLPLLLPKIRSEHRGMRGWIVPVLWVMATVLSQNVTGLVAVTAVALMWLWTTHARRAAWLAVCAVFAAVAILIASSGVGGRLSQVTQSLAEGDMYDVLSARGDGWTAAFQMIATAPLTGIGGGQFSREYYPSRIAWLDSHGGTGNRGELATHFGWTHNEPLQVVAELGIPGLVWMAALVVSLIAARRHDPLLRVAAAAFAPFALLHYPVHLAVGLVPLTLILGELMRDDRRVVISGLRPPYRHIVSAAMIVAAAWVVLWQLQRAEMNVWDGTTERILAAATGRLEPGRSALLLSAVEQQAANRLNSHRSAAPALWRVIGRARYARGDAVGAEQAFRTAWALWPHEEADFGIGLALAAQGRRNEAIVNLRRVCRTNPALVELIADDDLRSTVQKAVRAYRRRAGTS